MDPVLERRTSLKSFWGLYSLLCIVAVAGSVLANYVEQGTVRRPFIVIGAFVPLLVGIAYTWLVRLNTRYRLFQDALEIESGIVSRRIENIQLFRIRDLGLAQSLMNRIAGVGDVVITSTDQSAPHYRLRGVANPRALYEQLREFVAKSQATRRTMIVEEER